MSKRLLTLVCCSFLLLPTASLALNDLRDFEIRYSVGSTNLDSRDRQQIGQLASYLKSNPKVKITLSGHTDETGPREFNIRLSHDRAAAVRDLLVQSFSIEKGRVGIAWLDTSQPVSSNATDSGRAANRRVVVQFVADGPALVANRPVVRQTQAAVRKPVTAQPTRALQPAASKVAAKPVTAARTDAGSLIKEVPLSYQSGGTSLSPESQQSLSALASTLKSNPAQTVLVQGLPHQAGNGRSDLQQARKRAEDVRARLVYGLKVPASQVLVKWFGSAADTTVGDETVGVVLKLMGGQ